MKNFQRIALGILIVLILSVLFFLITSEYWSLNTDNDRSAQTQVAVYHESAAPQTQVAVYHESAATQTQQAIYYEIANTQTQQAIYYEVADTQTQQARIVNQTQSAIYYESTTISQTRTQQAYVIAATQTQQVRDLKQTQTAIHDAIASTTPVYTPSYTPTASRTPSPSLVPELTGQIWLLENNQDAFFSLPDHEFEPIEDGQDIADGLIIISNTSHLGIQLTHGAFIEISPNSLLTLDNVSDFEQGLELSISSGTVVVTKGDWPQVIIDSEQKIEVGDNNR